MKYLIILGLFINVLMGVFSHLCAESRGDIDESFYHQTEVNNTNRAVLSIGIDGKPCVLDPGAYRQRGRYLDETNEDFDSIVSKALLICSPSKEEKIVKQLEEGIIHPAIGSVETQDGAMPVKVGVISDQIVSSEVSSAVVFLGFGLRTAAVGGAALGTGAVVAFKGTALVVTSMAVLSFWILAHHLTSDGEFPLLQVLRRGEGWENGYRLDGSYLERIAAKDPGTLTLREQADLALQARLEGTSGMLFEWTSGIIFEGMTPITDIRFEDLRPWGDGAASTQVQEKTAGDGGLPWSSDHKHESDVKPKNLTADWPGDIRPVGVDITMVDTQVTMVNNQAADWPVHFIRSQTPNGASIAWLGAKPVDGAASLMVPTTDIRFEDLRPWGDGVTPIQWETAGTGTTPVQEANVDSRLSWSSSDNTKAPYSHKYGMATYGDGGVAIHSLLRPSPTRLDPRPAFMSQVPEVLGRTEVLKRSESASYSIGDPRVVGEEESGPERSSGHIIEQDFEHEWDGLVPDVVPETSKPGRGETHWGGRIERDPDELY